MNIMTRVKIFHTCSIGQRQEEGCWGEGESHGWLVPVLLSPVPCGDHASSDKHFNTHP